MASAFPLYFRQLDTDKKVPHNNSTMIPEYPASLTAAGLML
jgi:hypothetical protein